MMTTNMEKCFYKYTTVCKKRKCHVRWFSSIVLLITGEKSEFLFPIFWVKLPSISFNLTNSRFSFMAGSVVV